MDIFGQLVEWELKGEERSAEEVILSQSHPILHTPHMDWTEMKSRLQVKKPTSKLLTHGTNIMLQ